MSQTDKSEQNEETKLTPLQRVKQQQSKMRQTRNAGTQQGGEDGDSAPNASGGPSRRVELNRRSGSSGS